MPTNCTKCPINVQVLGYVIALAKEMRKDGEDLQGPLAMIVTETEVQVFLFPFQHDKSVLVTALALAPIKLFNCDTTVELDLSSLFFLAFITKKRPSSNTVLEDTQFSQELMIV